MNKCFIIGRISRKEELGTSKNGTSYIKMTVAVHRRGMDETDFLPVLAFGRTAENCDKYLSKGSQVAVEGEMHINLYKREDGTRTRDFSVSASAIEFLSSKTSNNGGSGNNDNDNDNDDDGGYTPPNRNARYNQPSREERRNTDYKSRNDDTLDSADYLRQGSYAEYNTDADGDLPF